MTRIVYLEDDSLWVELVRRELAADSTDLELEVVPTTEAFVHRLEELAADPPDLFLLDVMVPWSDKLESRQGSYPFHEAGLRVLADMRAHGLAVPIVMFTILERRHLVLPEGEEELAGWTYVSKDEPADEFLRAIRRALSVGGGRHGETSSSDS